MQEFNKNKFRSKLIRISSEDKNSASTSNSDFEIDLPKDGGTINRVAGIAVKSISCPNIFYNVNLFNNSWSMSNNAGGAFTLTIAVGQYTLAEFITAMEAKMLADTGVALVITSDAATGIQTWTFGADTVWEIFLSGSTGAGLIGLTADVTSGATSVLTLNAPPNLTGETELYVYSRTLASGQLIEPDGVFNVVDVLPLNVAYGGVAYLEDIDEGLHNVAYSSLESFKKIDIRLRNRAGDLLVLPDNFNFSMLIKIYYE